MPDLADIGPSSHLRSCHYVSGTIFVIYDTWVVVIITYVRYKMQPTRSMYMLCLAPIATEGAIDLTM